MQQEYRLPRGRHSKPLFLTGKYFSNNFLSLNILVMRPGENCSPHTSHEVPRRSEDLSITSSTNGEQKGCNKNAKLEEGQIVLAH